MSPDDSLLPLSALQHLLFCERQCALIHLEQLWAENRLTVEGQHLHRKAHQGVSERRGRVWTLRGLLLRSERLGLIGKADVVEVEPPADWEIGRAAAGELFDLLRRDGASGWRVTPVEYKRGKPKADDSDRVQLAAQALCLEEMLGLRIGEGWLFYGAQRRRTEVTLDDALRATVARTAGRLHEIFDSGRTPPARRMKKCRNCSLVELCLPDVVHRQAAAYTERMLRDHLASPIPGSDPFDV